MTCVTQFPSVEAMEQVAKGMEESFSFVPKLPRSCRKA